MIGPNASIISGVIPSLSRRVAAAILHPLRLSGALRDAALQRIRKRRVGRNQTDPHVFETLRKQSAITDGHSVPKHLVALAQ